MIAWLSPPIVQTSGERASNSKSMLLPERGAETMKTGATSGEERTWVEMVSLIRTLRVTLGIETDCVNGPWPVEGSRCRCREPGAPRRGATSARASLGDLRVERRPDDRLAQRFESETSLRKARSPASAGSAASKAVDRRAIRGPAGGASRCAVHSACQC